MSKKKIPVAALPARLDKRLSFYSGLFVLAIFIVHPLVIGPLGYQNVTQWKYNSFLAILGISVFLMVCAALYTLMLGHTPKLRLKERFRSLRPFEIALLGYWVVLLLSACTSNDLNTAFMGASLRNEGFWYQSAYILAFFIVSRYYKPKARDLLIMVSVASLVCVYAILQYYGNDFLHFRPIMAAAVPHVDQIIHFSTMSNVNVTSTYLCIMLCVSLTMFARHEGKLRLAFLAPAWIIFYVLLLGDTESGYVGLLLALALCFPFAAKDKKSAARLLFALAGCALLAWVFGKAYVAYFYEKDSPPFAFVLGYMPLLSGILAAVSALLYFAPLPELRPLVWRIGWLALMAAVLVAGVIALPTLAEVTGNTTLNEVSQILSGDAPENFGSGRGVAWKQALSLVPEHPILGHGPDNFGAVYMERFAVADELPFDKAHNEYLQTLVDTGALGLLGILSFYALLLWATRKKLDSAIAVSVAIALVAFMGQAFFNFSTPFAHPIAWTCWGVLGAALREDEDSRGALYAPARRERRGLARR